ncbi:MAG: dynamin family protein [Bradymonadales bacterium]
MLQNQIAKIEELANIAQELGLFAIAKDLRERQIPALNTKRVHVAVLGEFNHGKSSLINAFVGRDCLRVGIMPTTKYLTSIYFDADTPYVKIIDENGKKHIFDDLTRHFDAENAGIKLAEHRLHLNAAPAYKQLVLTDSPGFNDFNALDPAQCSQLLNRSDILLFVLDATQALKQSELQFIRSIEPTIAQKTIIFVINKADLLTSEELSEVRAYVEAKLQASFAELKIFAISARKPDDYEFEEFRQSILQRASQREESTQLAAAKLCLEQNTTLIRWFLQILEQNAKREPKIMQKRIAEAKKKLSPKNKISPNSSAIAQKTADILAWSKHEVEAFSSDFASAIEREIDKASPKDVELYLGEFIAEEFTIFATEHGQKIENKLQNMSKELLMDFAAATIQNLGELHDFDEQQNALVFKDARQNRDNSLMLLAAASLSAYFLLNALSAGVIALTLPFFSYFIGKKNQAQAIARSKNLAQESIHALANTLSLRAAQSVQDYSLALQNFIDNSGLKLSQQIIEALEFQLKNQENSKINYKAIAQKLQEL